MSSSNDEFDSLVHRTPSTMNLRVATLAGLLALFSACDGIDVGGPPDFPEPRSPEAFKKWSEQPAWSPDGNTIIFTYYARTEDELALGASQLWSYSLVDGTVTYLTAGGYATWSPLGDVIAYTRNSSLWKMNVHSGEKEKLTDVEPVFQPRWSPTGTTILFIRWTPSQELWTIDSDGSNLRNAEMPGFSADWSPDGTTIVCSSPSVSHLLTGPFFGTPPDTLLSVAPAFCVYPRWAPNGAWIAYYRYSGGLPKGLRFVRSDGTEDHEVVPRGRGSSWSPDGKQLVYELGAEVPDNVWLPPDGDINLWVYSVVDGTSRPLFDE